MSAPAVQCEMCGGPNEARARACGYCRAPLCTVRCSHCFQMSPPQALHCSGCGTELGLEPIELPQQLHCLECGAPMKSFNGDPGYLHDCDACGGQFVDHLLLRDLLERRTLYGRQVPPHLLRANPLLRPVRYFKCPACKKSLLRQNFGGKSGIIVNTCTQHGTWFHPGELPRVLAFVEAGGLREAKRAELGLPNNLNDAERRALGEALQKARERDSPLLEMNVMTGVGEVAQDVFDSCKGMLESVGTWLNRKK